jgi:parallel beta-helix repeat protein
MKAKWVAATILSVLFVSLAVLIVNQQPPTSPGHLPRNRAPILIDADTDFNADHGVVGGSGIISDPYVIEGWEINASLNCPERSCAGITVRNVNASFVIRNVNIWGPDSSGIRLSTVRNARLESVSVAFGGDGISVTASANVTILESLVVGCGQGIHITGSHDVRVYAGNVSHGSQGIVAEDSSRVSLINSVLNGNNANGLLFSNVTNGTIEGNTITETGFRGIALFDSSGIVTNRNRIDGTGEDCLYVARGIGASIIENEISNCTWDGISVYLSDENIVKGNFVAKTPSGIVLYDSSRNVLLSNNVTDTGWGITVSSDSDANFVLGNTVSRSSSVGIVLTGEDDQAPDRNVIQGNRVSQSGKTDLLDRSRGTGNLWRFNTYEKETLST